MKVLKWLNDHFEEFLLVVLLVIISCVSLLQVVIRNIPWIPALKWAEEFCRFCWIWSVFLSLPYTIRRGSMLRVTVLLDAMPETLRKCVNIFVDLVIVAAMGFMACYSYPTVMKIYLSAETSPAMAWPMWAIYSMMLVGFVLGTIRAIQKTADHIRHFGERQLSTVEQAMADAEEEIALAEEGGDA